MRGGMLAAQLATLLEPGYPAILACAGTALALSLGHWWLSENPRVIWWLIGVLAALLASSWHLWSFRRAGSAALATPRKWFRRHFLVIFLVAAAWGAASLFLMPHSSQASALLLAATLFGMASAGAYANAASRIALFAWLLPVLCPLIVVMLFEDSSISNALGMAGVVCLIAAISFADKQHKLLRSAWQTKLENDALVGKLRQQVDLVEKANREKSRFLGAASHDLRQPMHAVGLFAAALEKGLVGSPLHPTVSNMLRAVDALEQSFAAMLDVSKLDAGVVDPNMQSFPIRDLFRRLHMQCAGQAEELGLGLRFKPGGKLVTSDPQLLERVLGNLIHNAIRYTKKGGIVVCARARRSQISIEVWDTGIGIAEEELPKVFDEFYQVHNSGRDRTRGLGMGLAIVKRLVLLMGHELEVKSTPGRGTVFRILLAPTELAEMETVVLGADTVPAPVDMHQTVLMIDDEESIRLGMNDLLRTWGYTVLLASSISDACKQVRDHGGVIDIVISDLRLANEENGIDAIERVRTVYGAPLPAVIITGDTSAEEVKRAHASGHPVLFKPVRTRDLYATLRGAP